MQKTAEELEEIRAHAEAWKNLACAIILQALRDATQYSSAEMQRIIIANSLFEKKKRVKFNAEVGDCREARQWFREASDDFIEVCDWAGLNWRMVRAEALKIINDDKRVSCLGKSLYKPRVRKTREVV